MASDMFKQFFLLLRTYYDLCIDFVFSLYWEKYKQAIPDLEKRHAILAESATSLAAKIRNKELKSEELVQACIERIKMDVHKVDRLLKQMDKLMDVNGGGSY